MGTGASTLQGSKPATKPPQHRAENPRLAAKAHPTAASQSIPATALPRLTSSQLSMNAASWPYTKPASTASQVLTTNSSFGFGILAAAEIISLAANLGAPETAKLLAHLFETTSEVIKSANKDQIKSKLASLGRYELSKGLSLNDDSGFKKLVMAVIQDAADVRFADWATLRMAIGQAAKSVGTKQAELQGKAGNCSTSAGVPKGGCTTCASSAGCEGGIRDIEDL